MANANSNGGAQAAPENHTPSTHPHDLEAHIGGLALELVALSDAIMKNLNNVRIGDPTTIDDISNAVMLSGIAKRISNELYTSIDSGKIVGGAS